ncbi:MAG: hypothetical protein MJ210_02990 [Alphaproteobacteria bacterium]|nr:hypothetical protein [Alphaproteobacteria bacterium]
MKKIIKTPPLLLKLKNIFTRAKRRFSWRGQIKDSEISAIDANDIQKDVYNHTKNIRNDVFTPPYMELAAQLLASEQQIFEASAEHLAATAKVRKKYAPEIKSIFAEIIASKKLSEERIGYLARLLSEM